MDNLYSGFLETAKTAVPYFARWTYDHPMWITPQTNETLRFLQKAMYTAIRHLVENYETYRHLMPISDEVSAILELYKGIPYRTGTYRTDFLIDEQKEIKLIEITCRFALNGFFTSGFVSGTMENFLREHPEVQVLDQYMPFFEYLGQYFGSCDRLCILRGQDHRNEDKYLLPIFRAAGYPAQMIEFEDIPLQIRSLKNAAIVSELSLEELCRLPHAVLERIIHSNLLNDLRTVFLVHDKRFFSVLRDDDFLQTALSRADAERFRHHLVPTFRWNEPRDVWEQARREKDNWIVKPRALGKGIGVRAGLLCQEAEWQEIFSKPNACDLTLQPYIRQTRFDGQVGQEKRSNDYVTGTLLFFDDEFFGAGFFRASSHPVTNQGDDRKIAPLHTTVLVPKQNSGLVI